MSTAVRVGSSPVRQVRRLLTWVGIALLVTLALVAPGAPPVQGALWLVVGGGPPLDFDAPHDGQVVAHIDVFGKWAPDVARIRISELSTGATVWDVRATGKSECWNRCWNLTLKAGANPGSFVAGHQQFTAAIPEGPSFSLTPGTPYLFEVWDGKGRVARDRFAL